MNMAFEVKDGVSAFRILTYVFLGLFIGSISIGNHDGKDLNYLVVGVKICLLIGLIVFGKLSGFEKGWSGYGWCFRIGFALLVIAGVGAYLFFRGNV
jgi:hypothetical protein